MASKDLTKAPSKAELAKADWGDDEGRGYEGQTQDDMLIPFVSIIEKGSPEAEEIKGAKPGMLFNSVTKELFTDGVTFVPAKSTHVFVEWVKREEGGGFVGLHDPNSQFIQKAKERAEKFNKLETEDGKHQLVETFYLYGLIIDGDEIKGPAVLAFASTRIKEYRRMNTVIKTFQINGKNPPRWAHRLLLGSKGERKDKYSWFTFTMNPLNGDVPSSLMMPDNPIYQAAKGVHDAVSEGSMTAAYNTQGGVETDEDKPPF